MTNLRKKFFITTTIPLSFNFFKGQLNFLSKEFEITAISSDKRTLERFGEAEGIAVHCIPMARNISLWKDFCCLVRFICFFSKHRPYIVHGNTPKASFLSMLAAKLTNVPVRIYMCHGLRYQGYTGKMEGLLKRMERLSCRCATDVICVSHGVMNTLIEDGICRKEKLKVVAHGSANGIDGKRFDKQQIVGTECVCSKFGITEKNFVFCFVGRIVKDKGINELVAAFKILVRQYTAVHLLLVGPVEDEQNAIDEKTRKEMETNRHIHAVGMQSDIRPFMASSHVFVLPSYREGFGVVLMEAGALGLPCITTDINGCNEIIQDGMNGKIIPPRDKNALYEAMKWFYEHRDDEVKEMALRARPLIMERYEQHKVWAVLLEEYKSLVK